MDTSRPHHPVGPRWRTQGMLKAAKQDHTEQLQLTSNDHQASLMHWE